MTAGTAEPAGDGWAKTVVESILEGEPDAEDAVEAEDADGESDEVELSEVDVSEAAETVDADDEVEPAETESVADETVDVESEAEPDEVEPDEVDAEAEAEAEAEVLDVLDADLVDSETDEESARELDEDLVEECGDDDPEESAVGDEPLAVEDLLSDLERVSAERDRYLDTSRRIQAEFENYKKQVAKREADARARANDSLVGELLPILDAFDGALASGATDVAPMRSTFLDALAKQGLERIEPDEDHFDPNLHEAVLHEDDDETDGPVVAEVMRAGYVWKGRVLRPAMVRTRG